MALPKATGKDQNYLPLYKQENLHMISSLVDYEIVSNTKWTTVLRGAELRGFVNANSQVERHLTAIYSVPQPSEGLIQLCKAGSALLHNNPMDNTNYPTDAMKPVMFYILMDGVKFDLSDVCWLRKSTIDKEFQKGFQLFANTILGQPSELISPAIGEVVPEWDYHDSKSWLGVDYGEWKPQ